MESMNIPLPLCQKLERFDNRCFTIINDDTGVYDYKTFVREYNIIHNDDHCCEITKLKKTIQKQNTTKNCRYRYYKEKF